MNQLLIGTGWLMPVKRMVLALYLDTLYLTREPRIGNYDCCWETLGTGQFRPMAGSHPYLGKTALIEKVKEYKVELVCAEKFLEASIEAMKQAHPYETPVYNYWKVN